MINDCQNYPDTLFRKEKLSLEEFIYIVKRCSHNADDTVMNLLEELMEETGIRFCDKCGRAFVSGFSADGRYYCSDKCLRKDYLPEEWKALTDESSEEYDEDCYWSDFGGDERIADVYNNVIIGQARGGFEIPDLINILKALDWIAIRDSDNEPSFHKDGYVETISVLYSSLVPFVQIKTAHSLSLFPISSCFIKRVGNLFDDKDIYLIADDPKKPITVIILLGVEEEDE